VRHRGERRRLRPRARDLEEDRRGPRGHDHCPERAGKGCVLPRHPAGEAPRRRSARSGPGGGADMRARVLGTMLGIAAMTASTALAEQSAQSTVSLGGIVDLIGRNDEADLTNRDSSGASNLDALRTTLFVDAALQNNVQLFTQFLIYGYGDVFLYG